VREALVPVLLVMALGVPLGGFVFVLDGVLIGAGDARYLALTGILNVAVFLPLLLLVHDPVGLWAAFGLGYIAARAITLGLRARTTAWMRVGLS
jgi:Na+-driven multidrug efflux pump